MTLRDRGTRFGTISIINHWTIAVLILVMLAIGLIMDGDQSRLVRLHMSIGVLVLLLGGWRVLWRVISGFPDDVAIMPRWQEMAARTVHIALLVLILAMPVSGYLLAATAGNDISFFGLLTLPALPENKAVSGFMEEVHETLADLLMIVLALHIAAAIKHHIVDRDATLRRMLGRD